MHDYYSLTANLLFVVVALWISRDNVPPWRYGLLLAAGLAVVSFALTLLRQEDAALLFQGLAAVAAIVVVIGKRMRGAGAPRGPRPAIVRRKRDGE